MEKQPLILADVYRLIEPGPVVLLTTAHRHRRNVMTQSWHTMIEFEPPIIGCVIGDGSLSFELLMASKECVINIPSEDLAGQVVGCGNSSGRNTDKFRAFGLTPVAAETVAAPLIDECFANLECKVVDTKMVSQYGLFIFQVVAGQISPSIEAKHTLHHQGRGTFMIAGETITLSSSMP